MKIMTNAGFLFFFKQDQVKAMSAKPARTLPAAQHLISFRNVAEACECDRAGGSVWGFHRVISILTSTRQEKGNPPANQ